MWANRTAGILRPAFLYGLSRDCNPTTMTTMTFSHPKHICVNNCFTIARTQHARWAAERQSWVCKRYDLMTIRNFSNTLIDSPIADALATEPTLHSFKSLSSQDKKTVAKNLGLKSTFLNDLDFFFISSDLLVYVFNYHLTRNDDDVKICPVHCRIDLASGKILETVMPPMASGDQCPGFMFCRLDKTEPNSFDLICKEEGGEKLVIFDDIFDALAFHQQTKLPTIVIKLLGDLTPTDALKDFLVKLKKSFGEIYLWPVRNGVLEAYRTLFRKTLTRLENFDLTKIYILNSDMSPFEMLANNSKEKFDVVLNRATPILPRSVSNFIGLKNEVDFEFSDDLSLNGVQWARFDKLNEHLKGFRDGEMTIVTGPTGCGKTTFVSEYSLDLCMQGVPTLWGSFEIKNARLIRMMMTQFAKKKMSLGEAEYEIESERFARLPLYFMKFQGQTDVDLVLETAKQTVHGLGIKHIVIDNLQFMLGLNVESPYERFAKQDFLISAFREFSTKHDCHITLVAHPRKEKEDVGLSNNSLYGGIRLSQDADNVLILMNKFNAKYRCSKYIQITKNRFNGSLGVVPLYFDKETLCFSKAPNRTPVAAGTTAATVINEDCTTTGDTTYVSDVDRIRYLFESQ